MTTFLKHSYAVAKNTFKEGVRDKIFYGIIAFAFVFITFTIFLGSISLGENVHIIRSIGLACIYLFGVLTTLFLGTTLIYKELERRTLYFILSKPIARGELVVGKFAGLLASVSVSLLGMLAVYLGVVWYEGGGFDLLGVLAVCYEVLELALLIAITVFFSTFSRPLASIIYAILFLYIGHSLGLLVEQATRTGGAFLHLSQALYYVLPNLDKFNIRDTIIYSTAPSVLGVALVVAYAALYTALLLWLSSLLLARREL